MKTLPFKKFHLLNREYFWWLLLIINTCFTYLTSYLLFVLPLNSLLKTSFLFFVIIQFVYLFFCSVKITTKISMYQSWSEQNTRKTSKKIQAIHNKLDELRESLLIDEKEGNQYWDILLLLDE